MVLVSQVWTFKFQKIAQRADQVSATSSSLDEKAE
jgi:hypothetical protein